MQKIDTLDFKQTGQTISVKLDRTKVLLGPQRTYRGLWQTDHSSKVFKVFYNHIRK